MHEKALWLSYLEPYPLPKHSTFHHYGQQREREQPGQVRTVKPQYIQMQFLIYIHATKGIKGSSIHTYIDTYTRIRIRLEQF